MTDPYTIPNLLTALRIVLIPVIVGLFYLPYGWGDMVAGVLFAIAGITDTLDGYVARRMGQVSHLGAFLDPVADKLIVATALVLIVSRNPDWYVTLTACVIIGREIAISALREWMAEIGARKKVAVSALGKFKTIAQIVGLSMMLFRENFLGLPIYWIGLVLTIIAAVLTLWSMALYLEAAWPELKQRAHPDRPHS
ncbi:MAG TPA: CDP-diacylglycerol--glycerol-3-phosphate 3-phosphatidyltransferase [Steroidobacteraceae bacterium]|nr:CDP-diacylglycerol--glycerol-3-phosphate 3-phosphatidyltransferase [Steroidobacteraceae bacterium]